MDSPKRVLIVGAKGCGKTSLIAQLTKKIATPKTTKLEENYQESKLAAKFKGHLSKLQILEIENEWVHFMAMTSVYMVLFDSRSKKSQQESTRIFKKISKTPQVVKEKIPIIMVFTKCRDDSATKEFEEDPEFHLLSTNAKSRLGVDELKLKMFQLAYPELNSKPSSQPPELLTSITDTVLSAISTIKSMKLLNTIEVEKESVVLSTTAFQLVNLPRQRSATSSSTFSLNKFYEQLHKPCTFLRSASYPA